MKKINGILVMMMWLASSSLLWAQSPSNGKISGVVIDTETLKPVEFATVALEDTKTNKPINGTLADDKGKFAINKVAAGTYRVVISFMGYDNITINDVIISDQKANVELGSQKMTSSVKQLKEVVVQGQRDLVEEKVDRLVYNAENDATTKGGDGTDVLRRVPMLTVDLDGNVSLRGNSNLRVLINNKPSTIAASSVADALKQIPADQIKSVEVITSPSAKYDAEGSAGIINIITKKNNMQGFTLGVDGSVGLRGANLGLNGSYRVGKMGFSLGGFGRSNYNVNGSYKNDQTTFSTAPASFGQVQSITNQQADTRNQGLFGNYTLGWDYDINKYNSLAASVRYGARNGRNFQDDLFAQTQNFDLTNNSITNSSSLRNVDVKDLSGTVDANLTYTRTFDKTAKEFSVLGSFSRNDRTNDFVNTILNEGDESVISRLKNDNKSFNEEVTIQADYQTPISTNQIFELGAKNISRKVSSSYQYFLATGDGDYVINPNTSLSNDFTYNQNVTSGYLSYTLSLPKSYSLKAGTRYEYTTINANFQNQEKINIPSYDVLVPSVNLSKKLGTGGTMKVAYNRRIQRPSLQYLNPNIQASNPLNITIGNPTLQPEYTNNYELSYSTFVKSTSLNISTFVRTTNDAIQSVKDVIGVDQNNPDTIRTRYQNIGSENAYGASIFTNVNFSDKFSLNGGTDFYYAVLNNNNPDPIYKASNEGWVYNVRMFGNYSFTKQWGLQFFGFYRGRQVQLQGIQGGFAIYSLSLRREFENKKGSVGVGMENFFNFNGWRMEGETRSPIIIQNNTNVMNNLGFKVNFSYRIGKLSFDQPKRRKSISNDDMKSEGDGGGGMDNGGGQQQGGAGRTMGGGARPSVTTPAANTKMAVADAKAVVNAEGNWTYTVDSPQGGGGKLVIKKEGDKLTGTITNNRSNKETPLSTVVLNGNEITIGYEVSFGGNTMAVSIKGTIAGDELNGTMSVGQFGAFPINGKKEK